MARHISDDAYERELCYHCPLDDCEQTPTSGCELKACNASAKKDIYLFIKRHPREIADIHDLYPDKDDFVTDTIIMLSNYNLIKFTKGVWHAT